jgi:hypothetical protein
MKSKIHLLLVALLAACYLQSCDDDRVNMTPALQNAFTSMYPNVGYVEWEAQGGYYVADFHDNYEMSAWFTREGVWYMTETDLPYALLPDPVKLTLEATDSPYATWHVDDSDYIEMADGTHFYRIELERNGERDSNVKISPEGIVL